MLRLLVERAEAHAFLDAYVPTGPGATEAARAAFSRDFQAALADLAREDLFALLEARLREPT